MQNYGDVLGCRKTGLTPTLEGVGLVWVFQERDRELWTKAIQDFSVGTQMECPFACAEGVSRVVVGRVYDVQALAAGVVPGQGLGKGQSSRSDQRGCEMPDRPRQGMRLPGGNERRAQLGTGCGGKAYLTAGTPALGRR